MAQVAKAPPLSSPSGNIPSVEETQGERGHIPTATFTQTQLLLLILTVPLKSYMSKLIRAIAKRRRDTAQTMRASLIKTWCQARSGERRVKVGRTQGASDLWEIPVGVDANPCSRCITQTHFPEKSWPDEQHFYVLEGLCWGFVGLCCPLPSMSSNQQGIFLNCEFFWDSLFNKAPLLEVVKKELHVMLYKNLECFRASGPHFQLLLQHIYFSSHYCSSVSVHLDLD